MNERQLRAGLQAYGVPLLTGDSAGPVPAWTELLQGCLDIGQARYADCIPMLLLANPGRAHDTARWARSAGSEALIAYTAAAALQRELKPRLELAGITGDAITDEFSAELGLPPAATMHGRLLLSALDDIPWQGLAVRRSDALRKMADLLLDSRSAHAPSR